MAETVPGDNTLISKFEHIGIAQVGQSAATFAVTVPVWTMANLPAGNDNESSFQVVAASVRFSAASSSGTLQVEVTGAGVAPGSGTNQLTGAMSLSGTANTTVNGTVITTPTAIAPGSSVNLVFAGTVTGLVGCAIEVVLKRTA